MKIALFEPDLRVCGPASWIFHLRNGYRELGHQADVICASKSGRKASHWGNVKAGGKWWAQEPDVVVKMDNLSALFDTYDFIILPEPKSPLPDKSMVKAIEKGEEEEGTLPWYIRALSLTKTPFTTALHGNVYAGRYAPYAETILTLPNFCDKLIVHSKYSWESDPFISSVPGFMSVLPYEMRHDITDPFPRNSTCGITGRFMFNKGSHIPGLAAQYLPPEVTVEIWGSCSTGRGPSLTFNLYEVIKPLAAPGQYKRYHNSDPNHPKANEDGNIVQPFKYDVRIQDHALVRYLGNYTDPVGVCERLMVHIDLTGKKYSGGLTEYVTMEAIDAGSVCITPPHVSNPDYRTLVLEGFENPPGSVTSAVKNPQTSIDVAAAVEKAFSFKDQPESVHRSLVEHNREMLQKNAAPAAVAARILEECL